MSKTSSYPRASNYNNKKKQKAPQKQKQSSKNQKSTTTKEDDDIGDILNPKFEYESVFKLDNNKYVVLNEFKKKVYIQIREFYTDRDGYMRPGKKGISLNEDEWKSMNLCMEKIKKEHENLVKMRDLKNSEEQTNRKVFSCKNNEIQTNSVMSKKSKTSVGNDNSGNNDTYDDDDIYEYEFDDSDEILDDDIDDNDESDNSRDDVDNRVGEKRTRHNFY